VSTFSTALAARIEIFEQAAMGQQPNAALEQCAIVGELIDALSHTLLQLSIDDLERRVAGPDGRPQALTPQDQAINRPC
jgi:hypothetical protein